MIERLLPNRVRRTYLGGGRIDGFTGVIADCSDGVPRPEDWLASTVTAFNGTEEIEGEGLGRMEDGRLVRDVIGDLPFLVKLLDSDGQLVIQVHPTVPCAKRTPAYISASSLALHAKSGARHSRRSEGFSTCFTAFPLRRETSCLSMAAFPMQ